MPISHSHNLWILETDHSAYTFGLNPSGLLAHSYWGKRLPDPADYPPPPAPEGWASFNAASHLTPEEFPTYTDMKFTEPDILVTFADGVRDLVLEFEDAHFHAGEFPELHLRLRDTFYPLRLVLYYRLYEKQNLIERWATIENLGSETVTVSRFFSAAWHLPAGEGYRLTHLTGRWNDEFHLRREPLTHGVKLLESRRLTTSHHHNPWFAVDRGTASEDQGEVWFGALAWSGNWKLAAEVTDFASTRIHIGLNDWDFAWRLNGGETFSTPPALAGYTPDGFGAASCSLHDHIREHLLPHGKTIHKVLYNSWEATTFNVKQPAQAELARLAAQIGVELFIVDDGWFHGRNDDHAALGDWWPDEIKFPHGLEPLIQEVNALGMEFGLWIEPEMVNPNSELYRAQPDWVIHFPTRARSEGRNQLILNLARKEVQEYLINKIDSLLSENNIAFIKWDMNRNVSEPGWPGAEGDPREIWVRYVQGVYRVWGELRARHPQVIWQSCSGGGGRADLGILRLADQIWVSDNTEATSRLGIQEGFSQLFPANVMEAWVTDMGKDTIPLEFRFHVSMCGSLGIGANLLHWSAAERALAKQWIAEYKAVRQIIQLGDQYRLLSPSQGNNSVVQYQSKDRAEGVLFAFRTYLPDPAMLPAIHLRGLDSETLYTVEGFDEPRSGAAWMADGLQIRLGNFQSMMLRITAC
jgi:alpha-galactosidase